MAVAWEFERSFDGLTIEASPNSGTRDWSASFWLYMAEPPPSGTQDVVFTLHGGTGAERVDILGDSTIRLRQGNIFGSPVEYPGFGGWAHVAIKRAGASNNWWYCWVDGVQIANGGWAGVPVAHTDLQIGEGPYALPPGSEGLGGRIAFLKVWSAAIPDADLLNERYTRRAVYRTSLWGEYCRIGSSSVIRADTSGNGNTLSEYGGVIVVDDHPPIPVGEDDGSAGYLNVSGSVTQTLSPVSLAAITASPSQSVSALEQTLSTASLGALTAALSQTTDLEQTLASVSLGVLAAAPSQSLSAIEQTLGAGILGILAAAPSQTQAVIEQTLAAATLASLAASPSQSLGALTQTLQTGAGVALIAVAPSQSDSTTTQQTLAPAALASLAASPSQSIFSIPYSGYVIPFNCTLVILAVSINASSGSAVLEVYVNRAPTGILLSLVSDSKRVYTLPSPLPLNAGDLVALRTKSASNALAPVTCSLTLLR